MEAGRRLIKTSFRFQLMLLVICSSLLIPCPRQGVGQAAEDVPLPFAGETPPDSLAGPPWAMEMVGLRMDLEDLARHWTQRQLPSGRFSETYGDSTDLILATLEDWAAAFEPVAPWPSYLSVTGDQEAFRVLMGLCLAFGDQVLGLTMEPSSRKSRSDFPEVLRGAVGTIVSYSYLLVPGGPAGEWLQAIEDRWEFDRDDPLETRIALALLRQQRGEERAEDLRETLLDLQSRKPPRDPLESLAWADLVLDGRMVLGPAGNRGLDRVRDVLSGALKRDMKDRAHESFLAEVLFRYRAVSRSSGLDRAITDWLAVHAGAERTPLLRALAWSIHGGDEDLTSALREARHSLEESSDALRAEPGNIWGSERVACREAFFVYSLITQSGFGTRSGSIPHTVLRYRDARGVLGLAATVATWADVTADGEAVVSLWQVAPAQATVWAEPALEGSRLGRSWWEVRRKDDSGEEITKWTELPYFKIGRVGPLVLGPRKPLRLKMTWTPGGSYAGQWSQPYEPVRIPGPPSAATR
jgi:hypothetical protein